MNEFMHCLPRNIPYGGSLQTGQPMFPPRRRRQALRRRTQLCSSPGGLHGEAVRGSRTTGHDGHDAGRAWTQREGRRRCLAPDLWRRRARCRMDQCRRHSHLVWGMIALWRIPCRRLPARSSHRQCPRGVRSGKAGYKKATPVTRILIDLESAIVAQLQISSSFPASSSIPAPGSPA